MFHAMTDLETFSTAPNAVILQLAAVQFDPFSDRIGPVFNVPIDPQSCQDAGLHMDLNNVLWWMNQSDEARKRVAFVTRKREDLKTALKDFAHWLPKDTKIWGNGAAFDLPILESAYRACKMSTPFKHWNERCYRTMKSLAPHVKMERVGVHHDALDDAVSQAKHLQTIIKALGLKNV